VGTSKTEQDSQRRVQLLENRRGRKMNRLIYIVGLVIVVIAVLSFFGLR
jgi:predicted nucleic acid-binding Zn ribbon protein